MFIDLSYRYVRLILENDSGTFSTCIRVQCQCPVVHIRNTLTVILSLITYRHGNSYSLLQCSRYIQNIESFSFFSFAPQSSKTSIFSRNPLLVYSTRATPSNQHHHPPPPVPPPPNTHKLIPSTCWHSLSYRVLPTVPCERLTGIILFLMKQHLIG